MGIEKGVAMNVHGFDEVSKRIANSRLSRRIALRHMASVGVVAGAVTGMGHASPSTAAQGPNAKVCCLYAEVVNDAVEVFARICTSAQSCQDVSHVSPTAFWVEDCSACPAFP
jgi:hypothetical protein